MSAAYKIPEVLVDKITLMCYTLTPNPTATMIKDLWAKLVFESCSIIKDILVKDESAAEEEEEILKRCEEEILKRCCYSPHLLFTLSRPDKNHYSGEITTELNTNRIFGYYQEGFDKQPLYGIEKQNLDYWNLIAYYWDNIFPQENKK